MTDFNIVGPIVVILALGDVILHLYLDFRKTPNRTEMSLQEPSTPIPPFYLALAAVSTLLAFSLVLLISLAWMLNLGEELFYLLIPLVVPPPSIWLVGLLVLTFGILLHGWSRHVRQDMAASWVMSKTHQLITSGPYSKVRHPSYMSYFLCFLGLLMILPSLTTLFLLTGIPGYYAITLTEEKYLKAHFGNEYIEYMKRTGRFLPPLPKVGANS